MTLAVKVALNLKANKQTKKAFFNKTLWYFYWPLVIGTIVMQKTLQLYNSSFITERKFG